MILGNTPRILYVLLKNDAPTSCIALGIEPKTIQFIPHNSRGGIKCSAHSLSLGVGAFGKRCPHWNLTQINVRSSMLLLRQITAYSHRRGSPQAARKAIISGQGNDSGPA